MGEQLNLLLSERCVHPRVKADKHLVLEVTQKGHIGFRQTQLLIHESYEFLKLGIALLLVRSDLGPVIIGLSLQALHCSLLVLLYFADQCVCLCRFFFQRATAEKVHYFLQNHSDYACSKNSYAWSNPVVAGRIKSTRSFRVPSSCRLS
ncbi:hypothetical protein D3C72_1915210 [compost metagenome]